MRVGRIVALMGAVLLACAPAGAAGTGSPVDPGPVPADHDPGYRVTCVAQVLSLLSSEGTLVAGGRARCTMAADFPVRWRTESRLRIERQEGERWVRVADTSLGAEARGPATRTVRSRLRVTPAVCTPGRYRVVEEARVTVVGETYVPRAVKTSQALVFTCP